MAHGRLGWGPSWGTSVTVNLTVAERGNVAAGGQSGSRTVTIGADGTASFMVATEDDNVYEPAGGRITATVGGDNGYVPHGSNAAAAVVVSDNDVPGLLVSPSRLSMGKGGSASYTVALSSQPLAGEVVTVAVSGQQGTGLMVDTDATVSGNQDTVAFTSSDWNVPKAVTVTAPQRAVSGRLSHRASANYGGVTADVVVTVAAVDSATAQGWNSRMGRTVSQQVVDALKGRFSAPPTAPGLRLTMAGEELTNTTPLAENRQVLSKAMGVQPVTTVCRVGSGGALPLLRPTGLLLLRGRRDDRPAGGGVE